MANSREKAFFIVALIGFLIVLVFLLGSNYSGFIFKLFSEPNWEQIHPLYVVKNSIPVTIVESSNDNCLLTAKNFDIIIDHKYFKRGEELAQTLNYDRESETIQLSCNSLKDEKSQLNIWYVTEDSPKHSNKFQYFLSDWTDKN